MANLLSLLIYWYTSKAFAPALEGQLKQYSISYFDFMIIGEIYLFIPLYFTESFTRKIRMSVSDGTFETALSLPINPLKFHIFIGSQGALREIIRLFLFIFIAALFFGFRVNLLFFGKTLLIQLLYLPAFLGIGLLISTFLLVSGRGGGVLAFINSVASLLAGSYFPLEVFPKNIEKISFIISPFTSMLQSTRQILIGNDHLNYYLIPIAWSLGLLYLGLITFKWSIQRFKSNGIPIIFTAS